MLFLIGQEYKTGEQSDVCRRNFLSCQYYAGIYVRLFSLLVLVHVHPIASDSCPCVLHQLYLFYVDTIFVFIDMNKHVTHAGYSISQGWNSCRLNIQRLVASHEERHQRFCQFSLTRTFRAEDIQ